MSKLSAILNKIPFSLSKPQLRVVSSNRFLSPVAKDPAVSHTTEFVKFSESGACRFDLSNVNLQLEDPLMWYDRPIVVGSLVLFMAWFFVLREENDIDAAISSDSPAILYQQKLLTEKLQVLKENEPNNLEIPKIEKQLRKIIEHRKT